MPENTVSTPAPVEAQPDYTFAELREILDGKEPTPAAAETPKPDEAKPAEAAPGEKTAAGEQKPAPDSATGKDKTPEADEKPKSGIDKRFSQLTRARDAAKTEAEQLRRELEALKAQPGPATVTPEAKPDKPVPPDPKTWDGTWDELETAKLEYAGKLADWKVKQALRERDEQAERTTAEAQQREADTKWTERAAAAAKADTDFAEAVAEIGPFVTKAGVADVFKQSEVGPEMLLELYRNDAEAERIAKLGNPVAIARELGKLEARILAAQPATKPTTAAAKLPKPPASVGGGGAPAEVNLDTCDMATFKREIGKYLKR